MLPSREALPGYAGSASILVAGGSCGRARWRCSHTGAILKACVGAIARSWYGPAVTHAGLGSALGAMRWLGLGLALGAAIDLADYMRFIRQIVSRLVYDGRGSLC